MREAYTAQLLRAFKQAPWREQTQKVAVWSISLLIVAVVGGLYLAVASRAGTAGRDLQRLEARRTELIQSNDELRASLARLRSVTRLADRARELGFYPAQPEQIEYLAVNNYPLIVKTAPPTQASLPSQAAAPIGHWLEETLFGLVPGGGG